MHGSLHNAYTLGPNPLPGANGKLLQIDVRTDDGSVFTSLESGEQLESMTVDITSKSRYTHGARLFLPVHRLCLHLADHFVGSADTPSSSSEGMDKLRITSIMQLWEVLYRRRDSTPLVAT